MPIYEYRCDEGHTFDVMQRITDDAPTSCEICGSSVEKLLSPVAVHFKGSGFYTTDYGKGKRSGSSDGKAESNGSESGSGSSESSGSSDGSSASSDSSKEKSSGSDSKSTATTGS